MGYYDEQIKKLTYRVYNDPYNRNYAQDKKALDDLIKRERELQYQDIKQQQALSYQESKNKLAIERESAKTQKLKQQISNYPQAYQGVSLGQAPDSGGTFTDSRGNIIEVPQYGAAPTKQYKQAFNQYLGGRNQSISKPYGEDIPIPDFNIKSRQDAVNIAGQIGNIPAYTPQQEAEKSSYLAALKAYQDSQDKVDVAGAKPPKEPPEKKNNNYFNAKKQFLYANKQDEVPIYDNYGRDTGKTKIVNRQPTPEEIEERSVIFDTKIAPMLGLTPPSPESPTSPQGGGGLWAGITDLFGWNTGKVGNNSKIKTVNKKLKEEIKSLEGWSDLDEQGKISYLIKMKKLNNNSSDFDELIKDVEGGML